MSTDNTATTIVPSSNDPVAPAAITSTWSTVVPVLIISVIFYFLVFRPDAKRRRDQQELLATVKKGEEVVTSSGIYGKVVAVNENDDIIKVEIAPEIVIKVLKTAVVEIVSRKKEVANTTPAAKNTKKSKSE